MALIMWHDAIIAQNPLDITNVPQKHHIKTAELVFSQLEHLVTHNTMT